MSSNTRSVVLSNTEATSQIQMDKPSPQMREVNKHNLPQFRKKGPLARKNLRELARDATTARRRPGVEQRNSFIRQGEFDEPAFDVEAEVTPPRSVSASSSSPATVATRVSSASPAFVREGVSYLEALDSKIARFASVMVSHTETQTIAPRVSSAASQASYDDRQAARRELRYYSRSQHAAFPWYLLRFGKAAVMKRQIADFTARVENKILAAERRYHRSLDAAYRRDRRRLSRPVGISSERQYYQWLAECYPMVRYFGPSRGDRLCVNEAFHTLAVSPQARSRATEEFLASASIFVVNLTYLPPSKSLLTIGDVMRVHGGFSTAAGLSLDSTGFLWGAVVAGVPFPHYEEFVGIVRSHRDVPARLSSAYRRGRHSFTSYLSMPDLPVRIDAAVDWCEEQSLDMRKASVSLAMLTSFVYLRYPARRDLADLSLELLERAAPVVTDVVSSVETALQTHQRELVAAARRDDDATFSVDGPQKVVLCGSAQPELEDFFRVLEPFTELARFAALLKLLHSATTWADWVAALTLFATAEKLTWMVGMAEDLYDLFAPSGVQLAGGLPTENERLRSLFSAIMATPLGLVKHSELFARITELLACFSFSGVLSACGFTVHDNLVLKIHATFERVLKSSRGGSDAVESFFVKLLNFLRDLVARISESYSTGDWRFLFSPDLTVADWLAWSHFLREDTCVHFEPGAVAMATLFAKKLADGQVPSQIPCQLMRPDYVRALLECKSEGAKVFKRVRDDVLLSQVVQRELEALSRHATSESMASAHGAFRVQPYGIILFGTAGVGKSTLCNRLHSACAHTSGHRTEVAGMLRLQPNSNFVDGAQIGQSTIIFDDIDSVVPPLTAGVDNHASVVNKFINVAPYNLEQADLSGKGKFWASYTLALYTTNFPDCRLRDACQYPAMFWRRFRLRVEVTVLARYADGAGALDSTKLDGSDNYQRFVVQEYDATLASAVGQQFKPPYKTILETDDKFTFFAFVTKRYKEHYEREVATASANNEDVVHLPHCPVCHLLVRDHPNRASCVAATGASELAGLAAKGLVDWATSYFVLSSIVFYLLVSSFIPEPHEVRAWARRKDVQLWIMSRTLPWWGVFLMIGQTWFPRCADRVAAQMGAYESSLTRIEAYIATRLPSPRIQMLLVALGVCAAGAVAFVKRYVWPGEFQVLTAEDFAKFGVPKGSSPYVRVLEKTDAGYRFGIPLAPQTFTVDELVRTITKRTVHVRHPSGMALQGVRLKGSTVLLPRHIFISPDATTLTPLSSPRYLELPTSGRLFISGPMDPEVEIDISGRVQAIPNRDFVLLYVPELLPLKQGADLTRYFNHDVPAIGATLDEAWVITPRGVDHVQGPLVSGKMGNWQGPAYWRAENYHAKIGDCGNFWIGRRGKSYSIVAATVASTIPPEGLPAMFKDVSFPQFAWGEIISLAELAGPFSTLMKLVGDAEIELDTRQINGKDEEFSLGELPEKKSSLGASLNAVPGLPVSLVGTLGRMPGSASMKTKVVDTFFRTDVAALEQQHGALPYFAAPKFVGEMREGRWHDPHTRSLELTCNKGGSFLVWQRAIDDYLDEAPDLFRDLQCQPLDDLSAITGVRDTVLGGVALATSAGPPFYAKKSAIIKAIWEPHVEVAWDTRLRDHVQRIEAVIRAGELYSPLCLHVLKDEAVTVAKNAAQKVRVFNILPYAFNHVMKKFLGPITAAMRNHAYFFESAVGMNIASLNEAKLLYDSISRHGNWIAFDKSAFDSRCSTLEHVSVCIVFRRLAEMVGYSPSDVEFVYRLCLSAIYPIRSIKGDLFMMSCSMPSGFWMTIHFNCVRSSLQARYAFFRLASSDLRFRDHVSQMTLGDDVFATVDGVVAGWYHQIAIRDVLAEVGAIVTSATKEKELSLFDAADTVVFLKRKPRLLRGMRVWALELKTLDKMLCVRRKTAELSDLEHHAVILSNVLAEAWMHGEEVFEKYREICEGLAVKYHLTKMREYRVLSFEGYLARYATSEFSGWSFALHHQESAINEV